MKKFKILYNGDYSAFFSNKELVKLVSEGNYGPEMNGTLLKGIFDEFATEVTKGIQLILLQVEESDLIILIFYRDDKKKVIPLLWLATESVNNYVRDKFKGLNNNDIISKLVSKIGTSKIIEFDNTKTKKFVAKFNNEGVDDVKLIEAEDKKKAEAKLKIDYPKCKIIKIEDF